MTGVCRELGSECPNQQISWTGAWKKTDQIKMKDMEHVCSIASVHVCMCCEASSSVYSLRPPYILTLHTQTHTQTCIHADIHMHAYYYITHIYRAENSDIIIVGDEDSPNNSWGLVLAILPSQQEQTSMH